ncbi:hypothetical protein [Gloeobacter kilaueensis]|nr:hypothetical protein [Gloeobacter kilaueensis]
MVLIVRGNSTQGRAVEDAIERIVPPLLWRSVADSEQLIAYLNTQSEPLPPQLIACCAFDEHDDYLALLEWLRSEPRWQALPVAILVKKLTAPLAQIAARLDIHVLAGEPIAIEPLIALLRASR